MALRRKSTEDLHTSGGGGAGLSLLSGGGVRSSLRISTSVSEGTILVNMISGREGPLEEDETFPGFKSNPDTITILVGNVRFLLYRATLMVHPKTMLGGMFGKNMSRFTHENESGEIKLESVSPEVFRAILGYYTDNIINVPFTMNMYEIKEACDFFLIPFNTTTVTAKNLASFMNELSNDGARKKFKKFLKEDIVSVMAECAMKGERECHIVCLKEEDVVEWDPEYPPQIGEDQLSVVKNNELAKFLRYMENREVAKAVLADKGLIKIRLGIEGFPTMKEKVKVKARGGIQVSYFYVQRPFIAMSWEKEELRSRHVDFMNVPTCQVHQTANSDDPPAPQNLNAVDEIELVEQVREEALGGGQ